ncbi:MAG: DUF6599 family protein [Candidatus Deferrimicrobiaceae bacterium]
MRRTGRYRIAGHRVLVGLSLFLLVAGPRCAALPVKDGGDASLFSRLAARSWTATEPPRTFGPNNLYEEIDGEAELFLPYGFRELTVGFLHPAGNEKAEVRLEIFRQATPRDAFGVFSQQRFPDQEVADVGAAKAIVSDTSLDFFQGFRFVRIRAASRSAGRSDLESLGREVSALLPGTDDPPPETEALRIPGLVDGSLVFHRRAILGYEVLAPGYEAKYAMPGTSATLLLITPEDAGPAPQFRERLSRVLPGFAMIEKDLARADLPSGTLWLKSLNGFHFGVSGKITQAQAREILSDLDQRVGLQPSERKGN